MKSRRRLCLAAHLADVLTLSRLFVALAILWLGWTRGERALSAAVLLATAGWISDAVDGFFARNSVCHTHLASLDYPIDVILTWTEVIFAAMIGLIPPAFILTYTLLALFVSLWFRRKAVLVLFMRGIDIIVIYLALRYAPIAMLPFIIWLPILAWTHRRRLRHGVPQWLHELSTIFHIQRQR